MIPPKTSVAIIIPSFNRPESLRRCLKALELLEGGPYEIIVVDDGSQHPLSTICNEFGQQVQCIRQDNAGPAKARNTGAAATTADFLAFTDDDCRPAPGWIRALLATQAGDISVLVGGHVVNQLQDNVYAATSQTLCDFLLDCQTKHDDTIPFFTSNNIGCARKVYQELNGFDETFPKAAAEDRDFSLRWQEKGGKLTYAPDASVEHAHNLSFWGFLRQHSNYGEGAHHLRKMLDKRRSKAIKFSGIQFYTRLLSFPWTGDRTMRVRQTLLITISQIAMINGYLKSLLAR